MKRSWTDVNVLSGISVNTEITEKVTPLSIALPFAPGPSSEPTRRLAAAAQFTIRSMSVVVVGSVAYDGVETPHGRVDRMLGGACTYISLASSYFTGVNIVGVVGEDFAHEDEQFLASRNINLEGLEKVPGKTFFWAGVYSQDMND